MNSPLSTGSNATTSVQRQLRDDWHNREFVQVDGISLLFIYIHQVLAENVKKTADFLSSFDLSCRTKLAELADKVNNLERKIEFLEARIAKGEPSN
jgi:uncharacterized protein